MSIVDFTCFLVGTAVFFYVRINAIETGRMYLRIVFKKQPIYKAKYERKAKCQI